MNALRRAVFVLFAAALWLAPAALAVEGESSNPVFTPTGTFFRWLNSAVAIGLMAWGLAKARGAFRRRAEGISAAIHAAALAKAEAEARMRETDEKLARLEQEVAALRAAAQKDAAAEAERIRAAAREEAEKIGRAAEAEIVAAERAARMELKALAARLSVERAEAQLRAQLTPETQSALLQNFVSQLAGSVN
jgi:F0F1-type ATP synthase membrane subunit b/b'